jgi:hypothetical protein
MANKSVGKPDLSLIWQGSDLPHVSPGDYQAVCVGWQGPQWVRTFRRWSLRLEFSLLSENICVSTFLNMGNDPAKPQIGRRSRFYSAWVLANEGAPRKGQAMSLEVFTDPSLVYLVRVADASKDGKDTVKPDAFVYSRIVEILRVEFRAIPPAPPNHSIKNQLFNQSRIRKSSNHPIN